jgi:hypothetical protein
VTHDPRLIRTTISKDDSCHDILYIVRATGDKYLHLVAGPCNRYCSSEGRELQSKNVQNLLATVLVLS